MFGQQSVTQGALLVTNRGDDVLRLLGHLVQEQVDDAETPLPDVDPLLGTEVIGNVREVSTDQRERDDKTILSRELQTHLEIVLEELAVETEHGEVRGLDDHLVQVVHHPGVEADGVE